MSNNRTDKSQDHDDMLTQIKYVVIAVIIFLVSLFIVPYVPNTTIEGQQRTANLTEHDRQKPITVGVSWPIAQMGAELVQGIELAISDIEQQQLLDQQIQILVRDDQGSNALSQAIATEFAALEQMSAVIGFAHNHQVAATVGTLQTGQLLQLVVGATDIELARHKHPYLVQLTPRSDDIAKQLALSIQPVASTFAVLTERRGYQTEFSQQFTITLQNLGAKRIYNQSFDQRLKADLTRYGYQIKALKPDVILFSGSTQRASAFAKLARQIGLTAPMVCNCQNIKAIEQLASDQIAPFSMPLFYTPKQSDPTNQTFIDKYQQRYGEAPNQWAAQGYDSMLILARAINQSASIKSLDLAWSINNMDEYAGVSGLFKFSLEGELIDKPIYIHTIDSP